MTLKPVPLFLLTSILISNQVYADNFSAQNGSPTITHSLALSQYVNMMSGLKPDTLMLVERMKKTLDYYRRVHILKTVTKKNYTVDCIPFAEQPALIDNPMLVQILLPSMMRSTQAHLDDLKKMGNNFDFNAATECPYGSVAILRPSKIMLTSELANRKVAPHSKSVNGVALTSGYTWEQGYTLEGSTIYILTDANQAYFKGPQNQHVTPVNPGDHSLNQFWYTTSHDSVKHPREILTYSTEFGIIASAYFTTEPTTTIFVFASIDNYGPNSCYNLSCPNFIQAPGAPSPGVPITNLNTDFIFQVKHVTGNGLQPGNYLTLVAHHPSVKKNANASVLMGYYPESLYGPENSPKFFSAGAEVFAHAPGDGTTMSGNYANPYAGYTGPKQIGLYSQNGNSFPYSTSIGPAPYGLIWNFGQ